MSSKPAFLAAIVIPLLMPRAVHTADWYVDRSIAEPGDGTNWEKAFKSLQTGIDAASDGDTVMVARAAYSELIHFKGKNITLTSTNPLDPDVVGNTVIDAGQAGPVVTFAGTEKATCVLSGFTIRNGQAQDGGGVCGGTWDSRSYATIRHNIITGNVAQSCGGGLRFCNGTIENNTVSDNTGTYNGGGLCDCLGTIQNNMVLDNSAGQNGGGLHYCSGAIKHNYIRGNSASWRGGGLSECNGSIENSVVSGNSSIGSGGGLARCGGLVAQHVSAAIFRLTFDLGDV